LRKYKGKGPANAHAALTIVAQHPGTPYLPGLAMTSKHFRAVTPAQKRKKAAVFMKHKRAVNKLKNIERALDSIRGGGAWMTHGSEFSKLYRNLNNAQKNILRTRRNIYQVLFPNKRGLNAINYNPNNYFFVPLNTLGGRSINNVYREITGNGISRYRKPSPSFVSNY
jgi:hypothetical protein